MKFYGKIGFGVTEETVPGVWTETIHERSYFGDVLRNYRRFQTGKDVNDDISITNQISIVADPYAYDNFHNMLYVEFMGTRWKASDVEVELPRLKITLGGEYNGDSGPQT